MSQPSPLAAWAGLQQKLHRYLPDQLAQTIRSFPRRLDGLQAADVNALLPDLLAANRALDPLYRTLADYVPRYLLDCDFHPGTPHGEILQGTFLFADVSGFTALTEMLAAQGEAQGRESLNQIMNQLFAAVLDPMIASGGDLLIFAGDAVLAYFPAQVDTADLPQAIRTALRMQRAIAPFANLQTPFGNCNLRMRMGLERGEAYAGVVGHAQRMELLVSGPATQAAMQAEGQAAAGQVCLGPRARELAKHKFRLDGAQVADDFGDDLGAFEMMPPTRRRGGAVLLGKSPEEILPALESNLARLERLAPFVPEDMLRALVNTAGRRHLSPELRPVAVQFLNLIGLEQIAFKAGPEEATRVFQTYFERTQRILQHHRGVISQVDAYEKGFFLLNTFGAPRAYEGQEHSAVAAALDLDRMLTALNREFGLQPPLEQRHGLTFGLIFTGEIGARYRRESVVAGPAVNRAARLMSQAQSGQIIVDAPMWATVESGFVGEQLPSVQLKGIDGEVVIVNVRRLRYGDGIGAPLHPLLDREASLTQLRSAFVPLLQGQRGQMLLLEGETGLGKTSLLGQIAAEATALALPVYRGRCRPYNQHQPFSLWQDVLANWLAQTTGNPNLDPATALASQLEALGLGHLRTMMGSLFSSQIEPQPALADNTESLAAVIISLWQVLAARQACLLVLDDLHWLDPESADVLRYLLSRAADWPLSIVGAGREAILPDLSVPRLQLSPLSDAAIVELATQAFQARHLDGRLSAWLCHRAGGNPLYAQSLARAMLETGAVAVDAQTGDVHWLQQEINLPLDLHTLLLAQFDQLSPAGQNLLKRAAVIGEVGSEAALTGLYQERRREQISKAVLQQCLNEAQQAGFLSQPAPQRFAFTHPLMRETIYNTISFAERRRWHTATARWLETRPDSAGRNLDTIAYHYLQGEDSMRALAFGQQAAELALQRRAYAAAQHYYERLLTLPDIAEPQKLDLEVRLADVLAARGAYAAANDHYARAAAGGHPEAALKHLLFSQDWPQAVTPEAPPLLEPWLHGAQAWGLVRTGQTDAALSLLRQTQHSGATQRALRQLETLIQTHHLPADLGFWLDQFVNTVLRADVSPVDMLDLPGNLAHIVQIAIRQNSVNAPDLAAQLDTSMLSAQAHLDDLVERGYLRKIETSDQSVYKPRFGQRKERLSSANLWSLLDDL